MDACPPAPCVLPRGTAAQSPGPLVWGGASFGGTQSEGGGGRGPSRRRSEGRPHVLSLGPWHARGD